MMSMIPTGSICFFGTKDLERTHSFYSGLLGLELWKDQKVCRIYGIPGGGMIGFCKHMEVTALDKSPIITLLFDNVDLVFRRISGEGYEVKSEPKCNEKFGIYHFFLKDPNGYTVEIQRFL